MSSKKSLIKGALAKSNKSPVKSLPSPIKSSVRSGLSRSLSPSRLFNGIVELAPASSNRSDPEYHANPDEISLGSSEDAEQAGPISDPHLLIEEIHDYNGPALHPDAISSPSNASKRGGEAGKAAANTTTTHKRETTKTSSVSSRVKKGAAGSTDVRKNVVEKSKSKPKTAEKQQQREATGTQRNTRSRREQAEFGFDDLDALLKRRRQERKKGR